MPQQVRRTGTGRQRRSRRVTSMLAVLTGLLVTGLGNGVAWGGFHATTTSSGTFASAATYPNYPASVTGDGAQFFHRLDEGPSPAALPSVSDNTANGRTGNHSGRTDGPTTWWPLDRSSATTAQDASGSGLTGTLNGATWTPAGHPDGALSFDGSSSYVTGSQVVDTTASFTLSAWVYLTATGFRTAITLPGGVFSAAHLQHNAGLGTWAMVMPQADATGAAEDTAYAAAPPALNTWTQLTGVYDDAADRVTLYVNGVASPNTAAHTDAHEWAATGPVQVGRIRVFGGWSDYWPGMLDDVRIYDRALPPQEVGALYGEGPRTLYHLDEASGPTAADSSGFANPATLVNGAGRDPAGRFAGAVALDGVDDHVTGTGAGVATGAGFSVTAWAKVATAALGTTGTVVSGNGSSTYGYSLRLDGPANRWVFTLTGSDTAAPAVVSATSTGPPAGGTWVHLAGVYDDDADRIVLYVDGVPQGSTPRPDSAEWTATGPVQLGRDREGGTLGHYFQGSVDEVALYPYALSDLQVAHATLGTYPRVAPFTSGRPGALQGAQQGQRFNTAAAFSGAGNGFNATAVPGPDVFTVETWFRRSGTGGGQIAGFGEDPTSPLAPYRSDRLLYLDANGNLVFGVDSGGSRRTITAPAGAAGWNTWRHVAAGLGPAGMKLYLDGVLVASDPAVTTGGSYGGYWRWGGGRLAGWPDRPDTDFFTGLVDEVAVYPTQLTDQQIARHFHANH